MNLGSGDLLQPIAGGTIRDESPFLVSGAEGREQRRACGEDQRSSLAAAHPTFIHNPSVRTVRANHMARPGPRAVGP